MSETLAFRYFPAPNWRPSGVNIEFNASNANAATQAQRTLLIGQMLSSGTAVANTAVQAYSQNQVNTLCGANSMLALAYAAYRLQDPAGEVWIGVLADNGAGAAATGSIAFSGTATAAGTLALYVMGVSIPVAVNIGDTAAVVAGNATAALNVAPVGCVGVLTTATIALTALHKGLAQNDMDVRLNYIGPQNGEVTPAGLTVTITQLSGGTTNPVLTTLLANLGTQTFDFIACPYNDVTSLNALQTFLSDQSGRWSAIEQLYGHVFACFGGTVSARTTFGTGRNDQHCSVLGYQNGLTGSPTPAWLEAADWCGAHAVIIKVNAARGVTDQPLNLLPPPVATQDTPGERNTMLFDGISTFIVDPTGTCRIDRSITTYQLNPAGQPDDSYLNTNLLFQAMAGARYMRGQLSSNFTSAGLILVQNGTPIPPGAPATTPELVLGAAVAVYTYLCSIFLCQDPATFAKNATAGIGAKGQVLLYLPFDFSDQIINIAILVQFTQTT